MLLRVNNLKKHFPITKGVMSRIVGQVKAVDGVSFNVDTNEVLGLVGESGCGKSTIARCVIRIVEPTNGTISFQDTDFLSLRGTSLKQARCNMQIIFQDPLSSLDPRMQIKSILTEPLSIHQPLPRDQWAKRINEVLDMVGLPQTALARYPHEFSGGQCQRIGIARALILNPRLIIADEPVSALDVSIQAQIINLLEDLKKELGLSYLFISHDLRVVRHIANRIAVMYLGKIVECGAVEDICANPLHPYSKALMAAAPSVGKGNKGTRILLAGDVPSPSNPPPGCAFHPRCPVARPECAVREPQLDLRENGRIVRCPWV